MTGSSLRKELKKRDHFESLEQEATLSLLRTSDLLENRLARLLRQYELTPSQYNVLRILRGEGAALPCLEIATRMIQVAPAITRVVDQLQQRQWVVKRQSPEDRRIFLVDLTAAGRRQVDLLDGPIVKLHSDLLGSTPNRDLQALIGVLGEIRQRIDTAPPNAASIDSPPPRR